MCLVEVENSPKVSTGQGKAGEGWGKAGEGWGRPYLCPTLQPVASCAMPVMNGMKVKTNSPATRKAR